MLTILLLTEHWQTDQKGERCERVRVLDHVGYTVGGWDLTRGVTAGRGTSRRAADPAPATDSGYGAQEDE